jgi:hypothetical protein
MRRPEIATPGGPDRAGEVNLCNRCLTYNRFFHKVQALTGSALHDLEVAA